MRTKRTAFDRFHASATLRSSAPAGILALALLAAGCGGITSPRLAAAPSKAVATVVPTSVADYGSVARPLLAESLAEARNVLKQMRSGDPASLGAACAQVGSDLSNQRQAFQGLYMPATTRAARSQAIQAYKVILGATDECGLAADSGQTSEMKTAVHDMMPGLAALAKATKTLRSWAGAKHS